MLPQCRHHLDYKDGSLHSVKWYKLEPGPGGQVNVLSCFFFTNVFFLFHKWGILGYSIIISINNDIFMTIFMIFYHEDDKKSPGPDDQFLHLRPKPTKAEANKAQRNRPQSFGEPPNICVNCRILFSQFIMCSFRCTSPTSTRWC